jgi:hypothetical protein
MPCFRFPTICFVLKVGTIMKRIIALITDQLGHAASARDRLYLAISAFDVSRES